MCVCFETYIYACLVFALSWSETILNPKLLCTRRESAAFADSLPESALGGLLHYAVDPKHPGRVWG